MNFDLHPRLAADTLALCDLPLSRMLLMNDSRFPWVILVPQRPGMREIIDLETKDQAQVFAEILRASHAMRAAFTPEKLNIGAIGNMVSQLHIHIIARFRDDAAWPKPVWGFGQAKPYDEAGARTMQARILNALSLAL